MTRRVLTSLVAIGLALTMAFGATSSANAMTPRSKDKTFIFVLNTKDYYYGSAKDSIKLAKEICSSVKKGKSSAAKKRAAKTTGSVLRISGWSFDKSSQFISTAVAAYCPGQFSSMLNWVDGFYGN